MFTIIIIIIIRIIITYYHNFDILAFIFFFLLSSSSSFSLFHLLSSTSIYMICSVLFLFLLSSSFAVSALLSISYLLSLLFILVVNRKWDYSAITSWILTLIVFFVSFFSFSFFFCKYSDSPYSMFKMNEIYNRSSLNNLSLGQFCCFFSSFFIWDFDLLSLWWELTNVIFMIKIVNIQLIHKIFKSIKKQKKSSLQNVIKFSFHFPRLN